MKKEENFFNKTNIWVRLLIAAVIIFLPMAIKYGSYISSIFGQHNVEDVRAKIAKGLYEKYGEEFVVDRIGTRIDDGVTEYVARIYPKSIIGTNKEEDSYYYGSATVDALSLGRLGNVGDDYSYILRNADVEKYLLPYIKKKFGERVLVKVDVQHKITGDGSWWAGYKSKSLEEMRESIKKDPERNRIELQLYVYIFDRIDNEEEKEVRRKQIFDFVKYLKGEGLFKYLEMGVIFIDERVLAPSYREYRWEINLADKVRQKIEGEIVYLPPMELRERMSRELLEEVDQMSEEELLANMRKIRKSELKELTSYNMQYAALVYSLGMLEVRYPSSITEEDRKNNYDFLENIILEKSTKYIFFN